MATCSLGSYREIMFSCHVSYKWSCTVCLKKTWTPNPTPLLEDYFIELQSMWRTLAGSSMFKKHESNWFICGKNMEPSGIHSQVKIPFPTSQVTSSLLGPMQVCRSKSAPEAQVCQLWEETYYGLRHPCKKQSNKSHTPGLTNTKALGCHPMSIFLIFFNAISVSTSIYFQSTHHPSTLRVGHVILVEYIFWNPPGELCYVKQVKTTVLTPVPSWRGWIPRKTGTKAQPITNRISVNTTSGGSNENCWMTICHSTSNRKPCLIGYRTSPW